MPEREPVVRETVTEGSVVVLPAYPTLFSLLGLAAMPAGRTTAPAFDAPKYLLEWTGHPMQGWGMLFLAFGLIQYTVLLAGGRLPHQRRWVIRTLRFGTGLCGFWCGLFLYSALTDPVVSFFGAILMLFAAWCHVASIRSMARDLVLPRETR